MANELKYKLFFQKESGEIVPFHSLSSEEIEKWKTKKGKEISRSLSEIYSMPEYREAFDKL